MKIGLKPEVSFVLAVAALILAGISTISVFSAGTLNYAVVPLATANNNSCRVTNAQTGQMLGFNLQYSTGPSASYLTLRVTLDFGVTTPSGSYVGTSFVQLSYGTGTPPACGSHAQGVLVGNGFTLTSGTNTTTSAPMSITWILSGLRPSTTYWFDVQVEDTTSASWTFYNPALIVSG